MKNNFVSKTVLVADLDGAKEGAKEAIIHGIVIAVATGGAGEILAAAHEVGFSTGVHSAAAAMRN